MPDLTQVKWPKKGWPPKGGADALGELLSEATGLDISASPTDGSGESDGREESVQKRYLVIFLDFPEGVILTYEAEVAAGLEDSKEAFVHFASKAFAGFKQFHARWTRAKSDNEIARINLSDLRHDPEAALRPVLAKLTSGQADAPPSRKTNPDPDLPDRVRRACANVLSLSDPARFRHYDPTLFSRLSQLKLTRKVVAPVFRRLMQRNATDMDLLFIQTLPSVARMREALMRSPEYIARHGLPEADIRLGYQLFLDRAPSNAELLQMKSAHSSLAGMREVFLKSAEFGRKYASLPGATPPEPPQIPGEPVAFRSMPRLQPCTMERVVFLHVPKCGGTTLHHMLTRWYGKENMHPERFNELYRCTAAELASKRIFSGHFDYYATTLIPGPRQLISLLRDPLERLSSLYNFHRAHTPAAIQRGNLQLPRWANQYDIDAYFTHPKIRAHPALDNSITRYFSDIPQLAGGLQEPALRDASLEEMLEQALRNLEKCAFIGFMDRYEADIDRLARVLDVPPPAELRKHQVLDDLMETNADMRKIEKQRPSAETLAEMEDLVRYDRLVYARAREIFS